MSQQKGNWAVVSSIDLELRALVFEMGVIDSFGEFHPEGEARCVRDPIWLSMNQEDFVIAAELEMALIKQQQAAVA